MTCNVFGGTLNLTQLQLCARYVCYRRFFRNITTMLIQKSSSVSTVVPFSTSAIDNLWHGGQELNGSSIAGVSTGNCETDMINVFIMWLYYCIAVHWTDLSGLDRR